MSQFLRILFILICLTLPIGSHAQTPGVEIYLETLDDLEPQQPPPAYEPVLPALPAVPVETVITQKSVPLPARKPAFSGTIVQPGTVPREKRQGVLDNAHKLLGETVPQAVARETPPPTAPEEPVVKPQTPAEAEAPKEAEETETAETTPPKKKEKPVSLTALAQNLEITFNFEPTQDTLTDDQKKRLIQEIIPMLGQHEDMRLEILSQATGSKGIESEARRLSLARARAIQDFLVEHGIDKRSILPRPLGFSEGASDVALLRVYRL